MDIRYLHGCQVLQKQQTIMKAWELGRHPYLRNALKSSILSNTRHCGPSVLWSVNLIIHYIYGYMPRIIYIRPVFTQQTGHVCRLVK